APRFDEGESGENGRRHAFVCRLVAAAMQHAAIQHPVFTRLANATWTFSQRYWRLVVVAMLLLLHIAVFRGVADPWARALLLAHLGLLLLWQPFLRAEQRVSPIQGVILSFVAFAVMLRLDWWLLAFWVVIIGGLGVFFARYLFSIGLPVERWLQVLAQLLQEETRPERFLEQAVAALGELPSVAGVAWQAGAARGERGSRTAHVVEFANGELAL